MFSLKNYLNLGFVNLIFSILTFKAHEILVYFGEKMHSAASHKKIVDQRWAFQFDKIIQISYEIVKPRYLYSEPQFSKTF